MPSRLRTLAAMLGLLLLLLAAGCGDGGTLTLATTTSTDNSGLLDELVPAFEQQSGVSVKVIAVGSGAAMVMGERGDVDVLLVHSPDAVDEFVAAGFGVERARVMFNDFIIAGPPSDPAGIAGGDDAVAAMIAIAEAGARFISRGDDSGTHAKEKLLWTAAGLDVPSGADWYVETGQGMGATLTVAAATSGYVLTDRATYLVVADGSALPLLISGDPQLRNIYDVIVVNPERHDETNVDAARAFRNYLLNAQTQNRIDRFGRDRFGQSLFTGDTE